MFAGRENFLVSSPIVFSKIIYLLESVALESTENW